MIYLLYQKWNAILTRVLVLHIFILFSNICSADINININQQNFTFAEPPRLDQVLHNIAYADNWYWPAAKLFRLNTSNAITLRNDVLTKLKFMQLSASDENAVLVGDLIKQIKNWQLADRVIINLDYDRAQTNPQLNPQFEQGQYQIDLVTRPNFFNVFGLVSQTLNISMKKDTCAHEYIAANLPELQNKDSVYLISADGQIDKIGIAYWNAACVDIMPGSQIFVPFDESQFFSDNQDLNNQIARLALNRIM